MSEDFKAKYTASYYRDEAKNAVFRIEANTEFDSMSEAEKNEYFENAMLNHFLSTYVSLHSDNKEEFKKWAIEYTRKGDDIQDKIQGFSTQAFGKIPVTPKVVENALIVAEVFTGIGVRVQLTSHDKISFIVNREHVQLLCIVQSSGGYILSVIDHIHNKMMNPVYRPISDLQNIKNAINMIQEFM